MGSGFSHDLDLKLQPNALGALDFVANLLDQLNEIRGRRWRFGISLCDQPVGVHRAHDRPADACAFQAGGFDETTGVVAWRILECAATVGHTVGFTLLSS